MSDNIINLITLLNRYTLNETITWKREEAPNNIKAGTDSYIPLFFSTVLNGDKFGIYEDRHKYYTDIDEYYWDRQVVLCILDDYDGSSIWSWNENLSVLYDLFDNVKYKSSGIDIILNRLNKS
ncbi:hypothetical protein SOV88_19615 [Pectobacterium brasiliense]|uniref:hypothetical protein n=1 Tax=Pectobacterium brasiliense TaxID=180957 RepID=UPI002A808F9F|nr:hypothetical protein [Pectobacterium brasiliense]MDY4326470.1 hypothetical protein [Pectobacterium brasiliense]